MESNQKSITTRIEKKYMNKRRKMIYTVLEDLDFHWNEREINEFVRLWELGLSLADIAKRFSRDPDEVGLLLMDLSRNNRIKPRDCGVGGRRVM